MKLQIEPGKSCRRLRFVISGILALASFATALSAQPWTSRAEYDLALDVRSQPAPEARLALIEKWKKQFPASPVALARAELALSAAESLGDPARIAAAAREITAIDGNHFAGLYWTALLTPTLPDQSAAALDSGAAAARKLLSATAPFYASAMKNSTPAASQAGQQQTIALAHRTLGWVEWKRGNLDEAIRELVASLMADPQRADVSAWLGTILAPNPDPAHRVTGVWHLARAAYLDGEGVLPSAERRSVRTLLEAAYAAHHGSLEGLDQIGSSTRSAVLPPNDFRIETAAEAAERKWEDSVLQANPDLQPYLELRRRLLNAKDEELAQLFSTMSFPRLKGTLIGCNPESRPKELLLGVTRTDVHEVLLKLDAALPRCPDLGTVVDFEGALEAFSRDPFLLTLQTSRKAVGSPEPPQP